MYQQNTDTVTDLELDMENQTAAFAIKNPVCEVCGAQMYYSNKGTNWTCPRWDCKAFNVKRDMGVRGVSY